MNARQAAKAAAKKIEELEHYNLLAKLDITSLNNVVLGMIAGKSPCEFCEEKRLGECAHEELQNKGCEDWWLAYTERVEETDDDDSKGIYGSSPESGART